MTLNARDWPSVISCRLLTERYAALIKFCAALINVSDNQPFHFSQSSMIFIFWLHCWSNRECIYYIYHLFCFITFMQLPFWFSVLLYNPLCTGYTYRENTCYNENKMKFPPQTANSNCLVLDTCKLTCNCLTNCRVWRSSHTLSTCPGS